MKHTYRTYSFLLLVLMSQSCLFAQTHIHGPNCHVHGNKDTASKTIGVEKPVFDDGAAEMAKMIAAGEAILAARANAKKETTFQEEAPEFDDGEAGMAAMIAEGERILAERAGKN